MSRRGFRIPKVKLSRPRFRRPSRESLSKLLPRRGGGWNNLTLPVIVLVGIIVLVFSVSMMQGGKGKSKTVADSSGDRTTPTEGPIIDERLPGIWKGQAGLNQAKLNLKLQALAPRQATFVRQLAEEHLETRLIVVFKRDASLRLEMESRPSIGPIQSRTASGSWSIVTKSEQAVTLDLQFDADDGSKTQNRVTLQFVGDENHVAMVAPTGPELSDCEPFYVFHRYVETTELAQQNDQSFNQ